MLLKEAPTAPKAGFKELSARVDHYYLGKVDDPAAEDLDDITLEDLVRKEAEVEA